MYSWYYLVQAGYENPWVSRNGKCFVACAGDDTAIFLSTQQEAERVKAVMLELSSPKKQVWRNKDEGEAEEIGLG
jgi:hypothetical protein